MVLKLVARGESVLVGGRAEYKYWGGKEPIGAQEYAAHGNGMDARGFGCAGKLK